MYKEVLNKENKNINRDDLITPALFYPIILIFKYFVIVRNNAESLNLSQSMLLALLVTLVWTPLTWRSLRLAPFINIGRITIIYIANTLIFNDDRSIIYWISFTLIVVYAIVINKIYKSNFPLKLSSRSAIGIVLFIIILGYGNRNKMLGPIHMCALGATANPIMHISYCKTNPLCYGSLSLFGCAAGFGSKYIQNTIDNKTRK